MVSSHGAGFRICVDRSPSLARRIFPLSMTAGNFSWTPETEILSTALSAASDFLSPFMLKSSYGDTCFPKNSVFRTRGLYAGISIIAVER